MRSHSKMLVLFAGLLALHAARAGADDSPLRRPVSLTDGGELQIQVPTSWRYSHPPAGKRGVETFEFSPTSGADFRVMISVGPAVGLRDPQRWTEGASQQAAGQSVEGKLSVESLCPEGKSGYFFSATDRAPKPGEFRLLTQGALVRGDWAVAFTVLSNDDGGQPKETALHMLRELGCGGSEPPAARAPASGPARAELGVPGAAWRLHLDLPGFEIESRQRRSDGRGEMLKASNAATGMILSAFVLSESGTPTSDQCLERYWVPAVKSSIAKTDVHRSRRDEMSIGEYTIDLGDGMPVRNRHVNAYLGAKGGCVDVHLSLTMAADADDSPFWEVLRGVTLH